MEIAETGEEARSVRRSLICVLCDLVLRWRRMNDPRCSCTRRDALRFAFGGAGSLLAAGLLA